MPPPLSYHHGGQYPPNPRIPHYQGDESHSQKKSLPGNVKASYHNASVSTSNPQPQAKPQSRGLRPLHVNEALQFSPLASIVPQDAGNVETLAPNIKLT
jgi:hypothetical protein